MILIIGGSGYIGSEIYKALGEDLADTIDLEWFNDSPSPLSIKADYGDLPIKFFMKYSTIILLAGHSSVAMANADPLGAYHNNILNFQRLISNISNKTKLIYASSSSVYNGTSEATEESHISSSTNIYDYTKFYIDHIAKNDYSQRKSYGLRFGTVNGFSENLRPELMINKMYYDAVSSGKIDIYGQSIMRPILDIKDLVSAIKEIVFFDVDPGIYNISSFNSTVGKIASLVSAILEVPFFVKGESNAYDFSMNNVKLQNKSNWRPVGSVETILESLFKTIDFGKARDNVSKYKDLHLLWKSRPI